MAYNRTLQHFTSSQELATVWTSGQDYIVDQLVLDNDKLYRCITAHTSGATFAGDSANWVGINPGDVVDIADGGTGQTTQTAAFDALAPSTTAGDIIVHNGTDNVRQAIGSDGQVLVVDSAQTNKLKWATIQQGSKNYIPNATFENGVTPPSSWSTFSTTINSTTKVPSGTITTPDATYTLAVSSSTPLAGTYSMTASTGGTVTVSTTGYGLITAPFTIDAEDKAKPMGFSFYYQAISGSMNFSGTSSNTFAVYIYAVDGTSGWIQPAGVYNLVQSSGAGICSGTFQTTSDSTQYRLAIIMINSVTGSLSMRFDDFQLGPQKVLAGAAVSDWVSYTPTPQGFTASAIEGKWRRVGDSVEVKARAVMSGTTGGAYSISAPFVVDSTKFPASLPNNFYGTGGYYDLNLNQGYIGTSFVTSGASPVIGVYGPAGSQWQVSTVPVGFGVGDIFTVDITYPVQGWSSNTVLSQDTDTRVVAASVYRSGANQSVSGSSDVKIQWNGKNNDSTASFDSATNYRWTNPVSGVIKGSGFIGINATAASAVILVNLYKNGSPVKTIGLMSSSASTSTSIPFSFQIELKAGEYLEMYVNPSGQTIAIQGDSTIFNGSQWNIERLSGPATIAASETVSCVYSSNTATVIGTTATTIPFEDKDFDTHGFYNPSTGIATIPVSGKYLVVCGTYYNSSTQGYSFGVVQGGSVSKTYRLGEKTTSTSTGYQIVGSAEFNCLAGDTLRIQATASAGGVGLFPLNELNHLAIIRVGN